MKSWEQTLIVLEEEVKKLSKEIDKLKEIKKNKGFLEKIKLQFEISKKEKIHKKKAKEWQKLAMPKGLMNALDKFNKENEKPDLKHRLKVKDIPKDHQEDWELEAMKGAIILDEEKEKKEDE